MKNKVILWIAALMVAMPNVASAYDFSAVAPSGQTLYYNIVDGSAEVTYQIDNYPRYTIAPTGALVIPDSVTWNGITYPVTRIGDNAFNGCYGLTSVVFGDVVTTMGEGAFSYCVSLASAVIGNSLTAVPQYAFSGCTNLTSVVIGRSVTDIVLVNNSYWWGSFSGCVNLTSITVDTANTRYDSRNNCNAIIETSTNTLLKGCVGTLIPCTVTAIGDNAFGNLSGLMSITIPNSVTSIGIAAFLECTGLTSIVIPNSVTSIGSEAFAGCTSLLSIAIPNSVTNLGGGAFSGCTSLTSATIGDSLTSVSNACFASCTSLVSVVIGNSVEMIGQQAFNMCTSLATVTFGNSVTSIGNEAFKECENLSSLVLPNSLQVIADYAFNYCNSLTSVIIPDSVITIAPGAFYNCMGLTSVHIGKGLTSLGEIWDYRGNTFGLWHENPFYGCTSLTTITVDPANTHYDSRGNCNAVIETATNTLYVGCKNTVIPNTVTGIGDYAYGGVTGLTSIVIPDGVASIGESAFRECTGLTSLNLSNTVTIIGEYAFRDCTGLTSVQLSDSLISIPKQAFQNCSSIVSLVVPDAVISIGQDAFRNCSGLTSVTLGNSLTSFSSNAFYGCTGLTSITIPASVTNMECCIFEHCYNLTRIIMLPETPPYGIENFIDLSIAPFVTWNPIIYVRCGRLPVYQVYSNYSNQFAELDAEIDLTLMVNDSLRGTVNIVPQNGSNILCSDSSAVILATAAPHYHFDHWSNGLTSNPATLYLDGDSTVIAYFAVDWYSIVGSSNNNAYGTVIGSDTVEYLDTVTLVALPNYGYHLDHWRYTKDNGGYQNLYNTDTLRLAATRNKTATAYFNPNQYTITLLVDTSIHGTVTGGGTYNYLANRTIGATANYGYHFLQWSDGNTDNPRTLSLTQDTILTAMFAPNEYTLTITSNDETIGTVTGAGVYEYLDTVQVTAVVTAEHYHFVRWNDGVTESTRTVTILSDSSFNAFFAIDTHTVAATVNNDNYGHVIGIGSYPYGTEITLDAVPEEGYYFVKWSNESTDNPATFPITGDTVLSAIFSDDVTPNLCMVSVQNNRNEVIWTKELEVVEYKIYREGNITGNYDLVATVPYNDQSAWTDQESHPMSRSYRYKMTAVDSWGNESSFSNVHKTIHLIISQGMGNQWNLQWNEYEGAEFVTYMIYRGNQWGNLQLIGQIPVGGNNSYTDENAPAGMVYYQVVVVKSIPCNITKSESLIYSNVATNDEVGITDVVAYYMNIRIADGRIVVDGAEGREVRIYDMLGRNIRNEALTAGVYMVRVGDMPARRVVVMR